MKKKYITIMLILIIIPNIPLVANAHKVELDFNQIFDEHGSIMILVDADTGAIEHANHSASEFYGYTVEQLENMSLYDIEVRQDEIQSNLNTFSKGHHVSLILEQKLANGDVRTVEVYACPHVQGSKTLIFATVYDITEEIELRKSNQKINRIYISVLSVSILLIGLFSLILLRNIVKLKSRTREVQYLSFHDSLTGLYNRRFFEEELKRLDTERNLPISIIVGDMNGLKLTNDIFGHDAGDELLLKAAEAIKEVCRKEDIVARVGGDEFNILLPNTKGRDAKVIVSRIKKQISKKSVKSIKVSISIGCSTKNIKDEDILAILGNAEKKMYEEKSLDRRKIKNTTIASIIKTLHENNPELAIHSKNVSILCEKIGRAMNLSNEETRKVKDAGFLHDIGKIALNSTLVHQENLSPQDLNEMKQHTVAGYRILNSFGKTLTLAESVLSHHERWDGTGYPKGLKKEQIPKIARIISVAEYYDAMVNRRDDIVLSKEQIISELKSQAGVKLDPEVVAAFIKLLSESELVQQS